MNLIQFLSTLLRCAPTEEAVLAACRTTFGDDGGKSLQYLFDRAGAKTAPDAGEKMRTLLKEAGVDDVDGAMQKMATKCAEANKLQQHFPEMASMLEGMASDAADGEDDDAGEDVMQAMALRGYEIGVGPDGKRTLINLDQHGVDVAEVMLHARTAGVDFDALVKNVPAGKRDVKAIKLGLDRRRAARATFYAKYMQAPEPPQDPSRSYLFQRITNQGGAAPPVAMGRPGIPPVAGRDPFPRQEERQGKELPDLADFGGREVNLFQRLMFAAERVAGEAWKDMNQDQRLALKHQVHNSYVAAGIDLSPFMPVEA
jgi:hypothetical protein